MPTPARPPNTLHDSALRQEFVVPAGARQRARWSKRLVLSRLRGMVDGELELEEVSGRSTWGHPREGDSIRGHVKIHDDSVWRAVLYRGVLGAGEAYADGAWSSRDLVSTLRLFLRNRATLAKLDGFSSVMSRPALWAAHALKRNTKSGSRANISAHYDLGNAFFETFLDETMTYSAGIFDDPQTTLAEASHAKFDSILNAMNVKSGARILEIGCGWGGFAIHAATTRSCHVDAISISKQQIDFVARRVAERGLCDLISPKLVDYRDVSERYDHVVSIEMIEAVGHQFLGAYLKQCRDRLVPGGTFGLQAITIAATEYKRALRRVDFIKKHIFPGTFIPSVPSITSAMARSSDLRLVALRDIGRDYAKTLRHWRRRFLARKANIQVQGFSDRFLRAWDYYFAYCEAGFLERYISNVQMVFERPCRS